MTQIKGVQPIKPIAVINGKITLSTKIKLWFAGVRYE